MVDLNEVGVYAEQTWGGTQAKCCAAGLVADIKALRISALRHPIISDVHPELRRKRSGMHHIYYIATNDTVEVLDIIHVQRDPGLHMKLETGGAEFVC